MNTSQPLRFAWSGNHLDGRKVSGETEATTIESLKRTLYAQGIVMSAAREIRTGARRAASGTIKAGDTAIFLRQYASLLKAGLPLVQALEICIESTTQAVLKSELLQIRDQLASGTGFCTALRSSGFGKDRLLLNFVYAAEQSGTLDSMMEKLANDSEKSQQLAARVKKALMYPLAVLVVALVVTVVLLTKVVPQFASTFADLGAELPALTRSVLRLSDLLIDYAFIAAVIVSTLVAIVMACLRRYRRVRLARDQLLCRLPIAGEIVQHACLARFCQILGGSIAAGVPLVQALQSSASATGNLVYEQACLELAELISQGQTLSFGVRKTACFPVMIGQLIHAGEQSGTLDQMLENCATRYEQSVDNAVDRLSSLIEPVIMTVLGIIIATLLLAMYLPVFRLGAVL